MKAAASHTIALVVLAAACAGRPHPTTTASRPPGVQVAVTIDDLPWVGRTRSGENSQVATRRLLSTLKHTSVPAVGFVNCERVKPEEGILEMWLAAGMELGNHTGSHWDLNKVEPDAWAADVERCHRFLQAATGRLPRYFRYPFLREGSTIERLAHGRQTLKQLGYINASVTIDNSETMLASAYGRAVADGDAARAGEIVNAYLRHMTAALAHFDRAAEEAFGGRRIPHVLLLHANLLNADHLGPLLQAYRDRGVEFITLAAALSDPAYRQDVSYVGPKGPSWIYRVSPSVRDRWSAWDDAESASIRDRFLQSR
jgi:peptidoglycan-N-acetylglucosamine deacetylase